MREINTIEDGFRTVELENGKRITFEYYKDAKGGRIIAGNKYLDEKKHEKLKKLLGENVVDVN